MKYLYFPRNSFFWPTRSLGPIALTKTWGKHWCCVSEPWPPAYGEQYLFQDSDGKLDYDEFVKMMLQY